MATLHIFTLWGPFWTSSLEWPLLSSPTRVVSLGSEGYTSNWDRRRASSWTFHADEGNFEIPRPLPLWPARNAGLENIWEVPETVGGFQGSQVMLRKKCSADDCSSIFAFFPSTRGHQIFPGNVWKANIWLPQVRDKNRSLGLTYPFWPSKERGWDTVTFYFSAFGNS